MKPQTLHGWTDEMCLIEGEKCCVWKKIPENEVEGHLISFVNLWFAGNDKSSSEISSIIRNVLLITPLGISDDLLLRNVLDSAIETAETPPVINKKTVFKKPKVSHLDEKEKADVYAFHNWLKENFVLFKIEERKTSEGQSHTSEYNLVSQRLRAVIGFCALLLMRLITKNVLQFKRYLPYAASKTFDRLFPEAGLNVSLVAPTPKFLESASSILSNKSSEIIELLYLLVFQYLKSTIQNDRSSRLARRILEHGCLNVLAGNGLGLVTLFQDVKQLYPNIEERELLSMIAQHKKDRKSPDRLINFWYDFAQPEKPEYSWKWARILSQNYLNDMSIRENRFLCCKFAALLADKHPRVFEHQDLKVKDSEVDFAIKWAESAKQQLQELNDFQEV